MFIQPSTSAHPTISIKIKDENVEVPEGIILDRYQVEYCPLVKELISRPPHTCWFVSSNFIQIYKYYIKVY